MAYEESQTCISLRAPSTALSTRQYHMVIASSSEGYFAAGSSVAGSDYKAIGVLQDAPTVAGEACSICISGITKIVIGTTALSPGDMYVSGANGVAESTGSAGAKQVIYGPWLSGGATSSGYGTAVFDVVGITT